MLFRSFYRYNLTETDKVVFQAHEWMTGMAALYLQSAVPEIGTIFTTQDVYKRQFYGRAGYVKLNNGESGSITFIGTVSPAGGNLKEPGTENTKKVARCFYACLLYTSPYRLPMVRTR